MTKYKRITGKVFGGNATATGDNPQIAQFGSGSAKTFLGTTDVETIQQLPAWSQGWIGAVTPDSQFPALPEMTGAMKVLSHQICTILQEGVSSWDSGTIYYAGNWVSKNGNLYKSLTDENQGNDPEADTINWINLLALAAHAGMPSGRYIDLSLGASGTIYTAPADGYFQLIKVATAAGQDVYLTDENSFSTNLLSTGAGATLHIFLPVSKNAKVTAAYSAAGRTVAFRFYYAQGAQL